MAAVAGLFLAGCAKEKGLEPETAPRQMRFAVSVDGATKAGMDADALKDLGEFYFQVVSDDASYNYLSTISWDEKSEAWASSQPMLWKNEEASISYAAVVSGWLEDLEEPEPYNTVLSAIFTEEGGTMAIFDDQSYSLALEASDLLSMKATDLAFSKTTGGVIPVNFTHALAKVNFQLNLAEGFFDEYIGLDDESPVDTISIGGVHLAYNFKALTGVATVDTNYPTAAVEPYESDYVPGTKADKVSKATFEAVLLPETFAAGDLTLFFSILGVDYKWTNDKEITLAQGKEYTIPVAVSYEGQPGPPVPPAPLSGNFTINANGDKVNFSRGNLQATYNKDEDSWAWTFAENQWDCLREGSGNLKVSGNGVLSVSGTVDLFAFSTAATYYGIANYTNGADYGGDFVDWGRALGFGWRTLSTDEWKYILEERATGISFAGKGEWGADLNDARFTMAIINTDGTSEKGLLIFPNTDDEFASNEATWGVFNKMSDWKTKCTTAQWEALAAKGCVFLPAADQKDFVNSQTNPRWYVSGSDVDGGYYWTSSASIDTKGYTMDFRYDNNGTFVHTGDNFYRLRGQSVRLVKDVEE